MPNKRIDGRRLVKKGQKLWDSLAVAGLNAARKNTPRLVILMISNKLADNSQLSSQTIVWVEGEHLPNEMSLSATAPPEAALVQ